MAGNIKGISTLYSWVAPIYYYDAGYAFVGYDATTNTFLFSVRFLTGTSYAYGTLNFNNWLTITRSSFHNFTIQFLVDTSRQKKGTTLSHGSFYDICVQAQPDITKQWAGDRVWIVYN